MGEENGRDKDAVARDMAEHYLALGALWAEYGRLDKRRVSKRKKMDGQSVDELRRRIRERMGRNGS